MTAHAALCARWAARLLAFAEHDELRCEFRSAVRQWTDNDHLPKVKLPSVPQDCEARRPCEAAVRRRSDDAEAQDHVTKCFGWRRASVDLEGFALQALSPKVSSRRTYVPAQPLKTKTHDRASAVRRKLVEAAFRLAEDVGVTERTIERSFYKLGHWLLQSEKEQREQFEEQRDTLARLVERVESALPLLAPQAARADAAGPERFARRA